MNATNIKRSTCSAISYALILLIALTLAFSPKAVQAQLLRPYKCGPVLKEKSIFIFDSLNQYLGIKPGVTFADIGASSGYYNGAMAVHTEDVTFYLQDVDQTCLNEKNLDKVLKYYSRFADKPVNTANDFHIVIGSNTKTNLPENSIDIIYSNATFHVLQYPDSILADLYKKLREDGTLAIRDEFVMDGKERFCQDKKCGNPLTHYEDFLNTMARSGFVLIEQTSWFGYPIYKFRKNIE